MREISIFIGRDISKSVLRIRGKNLNSPEGHHREGLGLTSGRRSTAGGRESSRPFIIPPVPRLHTAEMEVPGVLDDKPLSCYDCISLPYSKTLYPENLNLI